MRRARQRVPRDARENETGRRGGRGPGVPMMTHLRQIGRQAPAPQTQGRERLQQRPHHGGAARAPRAARGVGARGWAGRNSLDRVDDAFDIPRGRRDFDQPARGVDRSEENKTLVRSARSTRARPHRSARTHDAMPKSLGKRSRSGEAKRPRAPTCPHGKANRGYHCKECPGKGSASTGGCEASARSAGLGHLRAREAANPVQGVQGREHLRAREGAKQV